MDKQPTEARQDELAGVIKKPPILIDNPYGKKLERVILTDYPLEYEAYEIGKKHQRDADYEYFMSLTVSSGGICPECNGEGETSWGELDTIGSDCEDCNGTGRTKVVKKSIGQIIKEAIDEQS